MYKKSSSTKSFTGLSLSIFLLVGVVIPAVVLAQIKTNTLNLTVPKTLSLPVTTKVIAPTTTSSTDTGSLIIKQFEPEPAVKSAPPTSLLQVSQPSTDKATTATPTEEVSVNKPILPTIDKLAPEVDSRAVEPTVKEVEKNSEGEIANQVERIVPVVTKVIEPVKVVEPTERDEVFEPVEIEVEVRKPVSEVIPVKVSVPEVAVSPVVKPAPKIEPIKPELKAPEVLEIPRVREPGGVLTTESDVSSDQAEDESSEAKEDENNNNNENKELESVQVERAAVPVRRPAVVVTAQDFEVVTASVLERASENVLSAKAESENKVSVEIVRPAKLFGILPVKIKEKVVVEKNSSTGQISTEVRQPWWSRLASGRKNTAEKAGAVASNNSVGQSWSVAADLVSDLVRALDSANNNNDQSTNITPVIRLAYARETGIPVASSEDLLIVDLEEKIVEEFIGSSPLARNRAQKENFVRVALSGTFRGLTSGQLTAIRSGFNSSALQSEVVAGTERVLDYLSDNGLTSQYRAFLRSVTPLFLASTRGGDAAADFLVRRRSEITSIFGVGATVPLLTGVAGGGSTMVVFHNCFSGAGLSGTCADMSKIISAISDPRSLFNTCHLGNMVADGPKASPNGGSYYGCLPTAQFCAGLGQNESADKLSNIASSGAAGGLSGNVGTSPDLANVNTKQNSLTSSQGQEVCTSGVLGRAGQNLAALESCMDNAISAIRAADRASTSGIAGCVGELLGISTPAGSEPTIGQQADAYLNGQGCGGLSDGADDDGAADSNPPATDNKDKEDKNTENKNNSENKPVPVFVVADTGLVGKISNLFSKVFGGGDKKVVSVSGGGVDLTKIREVDVDGNEPLELKPPAPVGVAVDKLMLDINALQQTHEPGGVTDNTQEIKLKVSQLRNLMDKLEKGGNKNQECSGEDCVCNEAMARTLQAITSCTDAALTQAALASGRGPESVPTGGSREPIGPYTNPNPETAGVGNADQSNPAFQCTLAILSGGSNAGGVWSSGGACGLMMCADGTTNCCHRQVGVSPALLQMLKSSRDCAELRCAPDAPCECAGELPEQGGVGPSAPTGPVDLEFDAPSIDIEEEFTVEPSGRSSGSLVPNRGIDRP